MIKVYTRLHKSTSSASLNEIGSYSDRDLKAIRSYSLDDSMTRNI